MLSFIVIASNGLVLNTAGVTFAVKVKAACAQLDIDISGLDMPAALDAANKALGIDSQGTLLAQADALVEQLGLRFESASEAKALSQVKSAQKRKCDPNMPQLVCFDLDFTLWQPELYQLSSGSPFKGCKDGSVLTARGERLDLFPAARAALAELDDAGVPIAIASRASEVSWAMEIMRLLRVDKKRTMADVIGSSPVVIQGGSKVHHLKHVSSEAGVPLSEIVFFDNERTNIAEVEKLGCTCVYCPRGLKDGVFREGLALHLGTRAKDRRRSRRDADVDVEDGSQDRGRRSNKANKGKNHKEKRGGRRGGRNR